MKRRLRDRQRETKPAQRGAAFEGNRPHRIAEGGEVDTWLARISFAHVVQVWRELASVLLLLVVLPQLRNRPSV